VELFVLLITIMPKKKKKKNKKEKKNNQSEIKASQDSTEKELAFNLEDELDLVDLDDKIAQQDKTEPEFLEDAQELSTPKKPKKEMQNTGKSDRPGKQGKPSTPRENLGQELIEVYEASGDDLTSVTTLEHKRRTWQRMLVWILVFLVAVFIGVAAISWIMWGGRQEFTGDQVSFDIEVSEKLSSGDEVEYVINYANYESVNFGKSEIELRYPSGFIFESSEPETTSNDNLWDLGSLNPGQNDTIKVKGRLVGEPESDSTVSGVFRYWPANFSSEFQEVASAQTMIEPINIDLRLEGSDQVLVGQSTVYSLVLNNESETDIHNLKLELITPEDFGVEAYTPQTEEEFWLIKTLSAGEEIEYQVDGAFSAATNQEVEIIALLSHQGADEEDYFKQKEQTIEAQLIEGDLIVNLIANGAARDTSMQWGDQVNLTLSYQNNSETTLADLKVVTTVETRYRTHEAESSSNGAVDFERIVDASHGAVKVVDQTDDKSVHVRTITWSGDDIESLEELGPETEGEINIQFPLLSASDATDELNHPEDAEVIITTNVIIGKTGSVEEETMVSSNTVKIAIDTDIALDAHSRYYNDGGDAIGEGPLPPRIGETTSYQAQLVISNQIHEAQDIIISMQLPSNVDWPNSYEVSAGEVEFNKSSSELTWRLNKMPLDVNEVTLNFMLELTPLESQVNQVAGLTKKMTMTATDSITGGRIIQTFTGLSTAIERDDKGSDRGLVTD
jgi:hypothetical protein